MKRELNGLSFTLTLRAFRDDGWIELPLSLDGIAEWEGLKAKLAFAGNDRFSLTFTSPFATRLRLWLTPSFDTGPCVHLIPGNIHGDNNAAHVRPGEFPCLTATNPAFK